MPRAENKYTAQADKNTIALTSRTQSVYKIVWKRKWKWNVARDAS